MRGGNYLNPTVLGFPLQVTDSGYFGIISEWNIDPGLGAPYASWAFDGGTYGLLGQNDGYFLMEFAPDAVFEFNATGFYVNGAPIWSGGTIYATTYLDSFSNGFFSMGDSYGDWTVTSLSGTTAASNTPSLALSGSVTGAIAFADANPTNLGFRIALTIGAVVLANTTLFTATLGLSVVPGAYALKVVFSPSSQNAASDRIYLDQSSITSTAFSIKNLDGLTVGTYYWDFLIFG